MFHDPDAAIAPIVGLAETLAVGAGQVHAHARAQLIYAVRGALTVITENGRWVLPPSRALGIPGGLLHRIDLRRPAELRTLYLRETPEHWRNCSVFSVSPLLRALILAQIDAGWDYPAIGPEARLAAVILDRLVSVDQEPVHLPEPQDPRARRLADQLRTPTSRPLAEMAAQAGASLRTLERLFLSETGLSIGLWRQRARLLSGLVVLAHGASVLTAALEAGYDNASSFTYAFRRAFGTTPARYFANVPPGGEERL